MTAIASTVAITAYAAPTLAPAAGSTPAPMPPPTVVDELARQLQAVKHHQLLVVGVVGILLLAAILVFAYFARSSSSVSLAWGFAKFELPDNLRKAKAALAKVRASEQRLQDMTSDFYTLAASLSDIGSSPERAEVQWFVGRCTEATQQILACRQSSAWLFDPDANVLRMYAGQRVSSRSIRSFTLRPGQGFAGHVFETQKPLWVDDVTANEKLFERDPYSRQDHGPMLGVPIWGQNGEPVGVLCASNEPGGDTFSAEDSTFASLYADLISVAFHVARLSHVELWQGVDYRSLEGK